MAASLSDRVSSFIHRYGLVGGRMVVAVSGGPDSVCLLHLLAGLKDELGLSLQVAHLDHGLRADSARDAVYVGRLARRLGMPVAVRRGDVQGYRWEKKLSVEEAAREVRYRFLAETAGQFGTPYIVAGHTRSDQVETILLHIIRGTGIRGLVGLMPLTPWTLEGRKIAVVRPLLEITRAETQEYCRNLGLKPRLDVTNLSLAPLRNRIRLELLPQLKNYNPDIETAVVRLSTVAKMDMEFIDSAVSEAWSRVAQEKSEGITFNKNALTALPRSVQGYLLRRGLERLLGDIKDIEMRHIEDIMSTIGLPAGRRINLPYGLVFMVSYGSYWLGRGDDIPSPWTPLDGEFPLAVPGITEIPDWQVEASFVQGGPESVDPLTAFFDATKTGTALTVRTRRRGDRFMPLGMDTEKKLGEFMIDEKIPRHWRKNVPIVTSPQHVIWVAGYRPDERVKVTDKTRKRLRLELKRTR